jgi:transcriptional regulator with XRE-family HTH domain
MRRRVLGLTRKEVASRIKASVSLVGYLESGERRPSNETVALLAKVLGFETQELFFLLRPPARKSVDLAARHRVPSAWEQFRNDHMLQQLHKISPDEMEVLSRVALLGQVRSAREFIYILNTVRLAIRH